jgi:hypothetical protein
MKNPMRCVTGTGSTIILALVGSALLRMPLGAQETSPPETASRELLAGVLAIFDRFGGSAGKPQVQIGELPNPIRNQIPDFPGTHVVGAVTLPFGTVVVLKAPMSADSLRRVVEGSLQAKGFQKGRSMSRGFVASADRRSTWCSNGAAVLVSTEARDGGISVADIIVSAIDVSGGCERRLGGESPFGDLPTLYDPEGASNTQKCFTAFRGSSGNGTSNALAFNGEPSKLLDHYGKQLQDSGWARTDSTRAGARITRTWMKHSPGGDPQYLMLSVTVPVNAPNCRIVDLKIDKMQTR